MAPLLLHLIFHPDAQDARATALAFHTSLNADHSLPNLAIPTRLLPEDGSKLPPASYTLDEAERSVVIVLVDDAMNAGAQGDIPAGRLDWADFAADLYKRCDGKKHLFLPVQLTAGAWPLHADFRRADMNFVRGVPQGGKTSFELIERRLIVEISRVLRACEPGTVAPIQLFLSHAKQDIGQGPFEALVEHLNATQPVKAWVDSAKIDPGHSFSEAIEAGVRDSAVLALVTEAYSSRPWCRREVLFAKKHRRPLVIIDALKGVDIRSFPYMGNAPMMPWVEGGERKAVDLLLKEQLRHLHAELLLERMTGPEDVALCVPPELSTLIGLPKGKTVLYPDPPLGDEETDMLGSLQHQIETPLQRAGRTLSLKNRRIALSISEPDSFARVGMFKEHFDSALLEISRHLIARGGTLVYAGHLGAEGYTVRLFNLVLAHNEYAQLPPAERVINYIGWPITVSAEECSKYKWSAQLKRMPMPDNLADLEPATFIANPPHFDPDSPARRFAWARGMTQMRERQTADLDARIALGGKVGPTKSRWYAGRIPGVLEEILLTLQAGKPLYLCGAFGGAAGVAVELLQGRVPTEFTWEFHRQAPHTDGMRELYAQRGLPWLDYPEMAKRFADIGVAGLAKNNHLDEAQNRELFTSRDVPRLVELLLTGLKQI
jgi:hypothetical protein